MAFNGKYERLNGDDADIQQPVGDSAAPPAYQSCALGHLATPMPPLPLPNAQGEVILAMKPVVNIVLALLFFILGTMFSMPLWISLDDESGEIDDDGSLLMFGLIGPLMFWLPALILILVAKTRALTVSSREKTIILEEYPLLRCNRTATKVLNTFRFGDLRACVLSVDTGIGNWAQRAVAMRTQQPHAAGSEPRGFISFLDNNGIYHEVFGGPGGVGRYARVYVALNAYLKAVGALPASEGNGTDAAAAQQAPLCANCANTIGANSERYIRLVVSDMV